MKKLFFALFVLCNTQVFGQNQPNYCDQEAFNSTEFFNNLGSFEVAVNAWRNEKITQHYSNETNKLSKMIDLVTYFGQFVSFHSWADRMARYQPDPPIEEFEQKKYELLNWYAKTVLTRCASHSNP